MMISPLALRSSFQALVLFYFLFRDLVIIWFNRNLIARRQ